MRKLPLLVAVAALAAGLAEQPSAAGESDCPSGFALVSGGVSEADANGDGLTCEAVVEYAGDPALASIDNAAASDGGACPDRFAPLPFPAAGSPPDRNGNGVVCGKPLPSERVPFVIIDDRRNSNV